MTRLSIAEALGRVADGGAPYATLLRKEDFDVGMYQPDKVDPQQPHTRDEVYVVHDLATGEEREILSELPGEKIQGLFSSDGAALLVNNVGLSSPGLWAKTLDGGPVRLVTAGAGTRTYPVRWSRAGLIYLLGPSGVILTVDAAGGTPREFGRTNETPVWDGWASISINGGNLYLACAVDEPRESDVWIADRVE